MDQPTPKILTDAATPPSPWRAWKADMRRRWDKNPDLSGFYRLYYMSLEETVWAVTNYRLNQAYARVRIPVLKQLLSAWIMVNRLFMRMIAGIDMDPHVQIGPGLFLNHPGGIHIHDDVVMGSNCTLSHSITIGVGGMGKRRGVPKIGDFVFISPGANISGKIEIGDFVLVGPNAVVTRSVPSFSVVSGIPGRVVARTTEAAVKRLTFGAHYADKEPGEAPKEPAPIA